MTLRILARWSLAIGLLGWMAIQGWRVSLAATVAWPNIYLIEIENGFNQPVHVTNAGDGSDRLFVVEQPGYIQIVESGQMLGAPFLDISATGANRVQNSGNEEGLLSVAFPPNYPNGTQDHFYVYYTSRVTNMTTTPVLNPGDNVVARYELTSADVADPTSEEIVMVFDHPGESNHNGGQLMFGPNDGYLYISTGDGGGSGDQPNNAQTTSTPLGKILRIDVETGDPGTYIIPPTNPYTQTVGYLGEIWALGLRNPWRFSFDRLTGDMYIGDVGQGSWEEIDFQPAAPVHPLNYGWRCYEGDAPFNTSGCLPQGNYDFPIATYANPNPGQRAVSGGYVYRGAPYLMMQGVYFYADNYTGEIWGAKHDGVDWQTALLEDTNYFISSFGEDEDGNLYLTDIVGGRLILVAGDDLFYYLPIAMKS
jgi:hypothetical protein